MINLKIGIVPNFTREKALDITVNTIEYLDKLNIEFYFDKSTIIDFPIFISEDKFIDNLYSAVDVVIAIGGDGSFIHTAKTAALHKKPVLCINAGNLAFLAVKISPCETTSMPKPSSQTISYILLNDNAFEANNTAPLSPNACFTAL